MIPRIFLILTSILPRETPNGWLRVRQYEAFADPERREAIARKIVNDKIRGQEDTLKALGRPARLPTEEASAAVKYWRLMGEVFRE